MGWAIYKSVERCLAKGCLTLYDKVSRLMKPIDATKWIRHFLANRRNRPEPEWDLPLGLAPDLIVQLRPSIEQFQLGDGGGPASLIAHDAPKISQFIRSYAADRRFLVRGGARAFTFAGAGG